MRSFLLALSAVAIVGCAGEGIETPVATVRADVLGVWIPYGAQTSKPNPGNMLRIDPDGHFLLRSKSLAIRGSWQLSKGLLTFLPQPQKPKSKSAQLASTLKAVTLSPDGRHLVRSKRPVFLRPPS